jgi:hypothetical protein
MDDENLPAEYRAQLGQLAVRHAHGAGSAGISAPSEARAVPVGRPAVPICPSPRKPALLLLRREEARP